MKKIIATFGLIFLLAAIGLLGRTVVLYLTEGIFLEPFLTALAVGAVGFLIYLYVSKVDKS